MNHRSSGSMTMPVLACLFAALISVGAYISLPLPGSPVPVVLQNMLILLAALVLGPLWGLAATSLYLVLGTIGLPVFAGGTGGVARLMGLTGGYLVGYLPGSFLAGLVSRSGAIKIWRNALASLLCMAVVYLFGVVHLKFVLDASWAKAIAEGLIPFLPGDVVKILLASVLAARLAPRLEAIVKPGAWRG
jgi:biotin transport system substrate-specific component